MSTMGMYCNSRAADNNSGGGEQLMLLRTLQDNERNIISSGRGGQVDLAAKDNVSVINVAGQLQQRSDNDRQQQQQQNNLLPAYDPSRLKKHGKNGQPPPIAVAKRNARERNRVKQVNNGFATLRQHIPSHVAQSHGDRGKKLSKVETLRLAVEYIRGLQRLLAEADGLDYDAVSASTRDANNDSMMIPSPSNSVYSGSTHNGSGDVLDEQQSANAAGLDDDPESYLLDQQDEDELESRHRNPSKRFRSNNSRLQNRLSENQNRNLARRSSPTYYTTKQASFGDEENIEPLTNRNNNNNNNNNNNLLASFSPILLQSSQASGNLLPVKREIQLMEEEDSRRSEEENNTAARMVLMAADNSPSPYTGEILIENPETGRLVPLKLEEHDANGAQLVYVAASTDGLTNTGGAYYKHELTENSAEFMDVVSWWEQEQGRLVHQLQGHHHHHHHVIQHQQTIHQQQLGGQQRLAHV